MSVVPPPVTDRSELLPVTKTELLSEAKPMAEVSNPLAVTVPPLLTTRLLLPPSLPTKRTPKLVHVEPAPVTSAVLLEAVAP